MRRLEHSGLPGEGIRAGRSGLATECARRCYVSMTRLRAIAPIRAPRMPTAAVFAIDGRVGLRPPPRGMEWESDSRCGDRMDGRRPRSTPSLCPWTCDARAARACDGRAARRIVRTASGRQPRPDPVADPGLSASWHPMRREQPGATRASVLPSAPPRGTPQTRAQARIATHRASASHDRKPARAPRMRSCPAVRACGPLRRAARPRPP
jgi:hypothetical protein